MKKNLALIVFLIMILYSLDGKASSQRWVPAYQKANSKVQLKPADKKKVIAKKDLPSLGQAKTTQTKVVEHLDLNEKQKELLSFFKMNLTGGSGKKVKAKTLKMAQEAVPVLIKVMRDPSFPDNSRWLATFLTGRIVGKKSASFMAKYTEHSNWVLRLASLKVLQALDQRQYKGIYARALKDKALVIRVQALEIVNQFKLADLAPHVWSMLYDENNYKGNKGNRERTHIIKDAILTVGNLGFKAARKPMLTMIQDVKYRDIHKELDISLSKISDLKSPKGSLEKKKFFWARQDIKEKTI